MRKGRAHAIRCDGVNSTQQTQFTSPRRPSFSFPTPSPSAPLYIASLSSASLPLVPVEPTNESGLQERRTSKADDDRRGMSEARPLSTGGSLPSEGRPSE